MLAIVFVGLFHAVIGYAFVTGLAFNVAKKVVQDLKTFDVAAEEPPPPEAPPPPPPPQMKMPPPTIVEPIVAAPVITAPPIVTAPPVIHEAAPPPPPAKPSMAVGPKPKSNPQNWLSTDDYPSAAMRDGVQGVTAFRLEIGADGKPTSCSVTSSSGSALLDDTTCRLVMRRAKFAPAKDSEGNPMNSSYSSRTRWQIPE